jgi:hypothetical protein
VIFLWVPRKIRLARLEQREQHRYGREALAPGGATHDAHVAFMAWAAAYDDGGDDMRSRRRHEMWLATLPCPCIRLEGVLSTEKQVARLARILVTVRSSPTGPGSESHDCEMPPLGQAHTIEVCIRGD